MTKFKPTHFFPHLAAGSILFLLSFWADAILGQHPDWGLLETLTVGGGLLILGMGFLPHQGVLSRVSTNICLFLLSLFVCLALAEGFFRAIRFDFSGEKRAFQQIPPYYRQPTVPTGEVYFRRPGPQQWTGQVLHSQLKRLKYAPNPYGDEPEITVTYNEAGFRNPETMSDWDIAVAGDSFTELGYLAYDQLFTSLLGTMTDMTVLNLGVSQTGPFTHLSYLREYGIASSTKHTVIVFFEGNDLDNVDSEYQALMAWQQTGQRTYRAFKRQPSMLRAFFELEEAATITHRRRERDDGLAQWLRMNAYFKSSQGDIPITLLYTPPDSTHISADTFDHLNFFFRKYAAFQQERQITASLVFMPSKRRVLHGHITFSETAPEALKQWQPNNLPRVISRLCDQYGIQFIDVTAALVEETRDTKRLLYNSVYDTHLNAHGSLIVAREMKRYFKR